MLSSITKFGGCHLFQIPPLSLEFRFPISISTQFAIVRRVFGC